MTGVWTWVKKKKNLTWVISVYYSCLTAFVGWDANLLMYLQEPPRGDGASGSDQFLSFSFFNFDSACHWCSRASCSACSFRTSRSTSSLFASLSASFLFASRTCTNRLSSRSSFCWSFTNCCNLPFLLTRCGCQCCRVPQISTHGHRGLLRWEKMQQQLLFVTILHNFNTTSQLNLTSATAATLSHEW